MELPKNFKCEMKKILGPSQYADFLASFSGSRTYGIRANTLKIKADELSDLIPEICESIPWTEDGYYYRPFLEPGKISLYHAGIYYIQEPSAMYPVAAADVQKGEKVLDLCASPGGKSVQIAGDLQNTGVLVCNDNNPKRISALIKNIELFGITNAVIFNKEPRELSYEFDSYFDKIFVDAPCSGEGMFRKEETMIKSYLSCDLTKYPDIQSNILDEAHKMLKGNGRIIYSTCTFNKRENEEIINRFIEIHKNYSVKQIKKQNGVLNGFDNICGAARLWPHKLKGEGHFVCILDRNEEIAEAKCIKTKKGDSPAIFEKFLNENLYVDLTGDFTFIKDTLHYFPSVYEGANRTGYIKKGLYLGSTAHDRFIPSHPFVLTLKKDECKSFVDLSSDSIEISKYLKGETLIVDSKKGFNAVLCEGFTIGWAKQMGHMLKNLYPAGWRKIR